ncbi:MAG TPA: hypothetical protein ENH00_04740, partial [Actinobacteria bacterium]|nr:hypothetical protein [Actinomycetota bacterium]
MKAVNQRSLPYAGLADAATAPIQDAARFEEIDWSFPDSTARGLTHGLHPWPAKFIPDIPRTAIDLYTDPGDLVVDPFCGSGTTAVEAAVSDRRFIVGDLNPLAVRIAEAKCEVPTPPQAMEIVRWARGLEIARPGEYLSLVPDIPNRAYWFSDDVAAQLAYLLAELRGLGHSEAFMEIVFSSIIVHASYQESETRYRRVEKDVTPERVLELFRGRLAAALAGAEPIRSLVNAEDSVGRRYMVHDAREPFPSVEPNSVALAVFSPPYPNAFDYHLYHR